MMRGLSLRRSCVPYAGGQGFWESAPGSPGLLSHVPALREAPAAGPTVPGVSPPGTRVGGSRLDVEGKEKTPLRPRPLSIVLNLFTQARRAQITNKGNFQTYNQGKCHVVPGSSPLLAPEERGLPAPCVCWERSGGPPRTPGPGGSCSSAAPTPPAPARRPPPCWPGAATPPWASVP